jgi:ectoine hydroxylase-related dioxygenase (phytanoyl-CoA dioxygenase family)
MKTDYQLKTLTQDQVNEFYERGFIILRNVFDPKEIQNVKDSFENLYSLAEKMQGNTQELEGSHFVFEKGGLNRIVWCGGKEKPLLDFSKDKRILNPVSDILSVDILNQIINQAHFKMPGERIEFKWHQDSEHRRYGTDMWKDVDGRGSYVQTILAIDEMNEENGPLVFVPNSNQDGHLDLQNNQEMLQKIEDMEKLSLTMKPGDLALFGPYTIHSSSVNLSNSPRRVLINGYAYPGANSRHYPGVGLGRELAVS